MNSHIIHSPKNVISLIQNSLKEGYKETFLIYLNDKNRVLEAYKAGTTIDNMAFNNQVLGTALFLKATGVILLQTRYSPSPVPWEGDYAETILLKRALNNRNISFIDHIIVNATRTRYFSMSEGKTSSFESMQ